MLAVRTGRPGTAPATWARVAAFLEGGGAGAGLRRPVAGVVAGAATAAVLVALAVAPGVPGLDPLVVLLLLAFVALGQRMSFDLFVGSSYSLATVPVIAAGMLAGPPGAFLVALANPLLRGLRRRLAWYKILFNASVQGVAAAAAAAAFGLFGAALTPEHALVLAPAAAAAGVVYYLHTAPVALAMAAELRSAAPRLWSENFRWLWPQYVVLSLMALLLALAYRGFGLLGAAVFLAPPAMVHLVARQYVDRTLETVRRLEAEITQREAAEQEVARLAQADARAAALEELSRMKSEFISVASHELRTPLTAVLGFAELLLGEVGDEDPRQAMLGHVHRGAVQMSHLLDSLLDASRIESGRMTIRPADVDLEAFLPPLIEAVGAPAPRRALSARVAPDARSVRADPEKLGQVLTNLLSNAVKYSPEGGEVRVSTRADAASGRVVIEVADQGIGIPPADLPTIFDRFRRVDSDATRTIRGTGLGLYIVRSLVELQGGTVEVESTVGRGSTFRVALPAVPVAGTDAPALA